MSQLHSAYSKWSNLIMFSNRKNGVRRTPMIILDHNQILFFSKSRQLLCINLQNQGLRGQICKKDNASTAEKLTSTLTLTGRKFSNIFTFQWLRRGNLHSATKILDNLVSWQIKKNPLSVLKFTKRDKNSSRTKTQHITLHYLTKNSNPAASVCMLKVKVHAFNLFYQLETGRISETYVLDLGLSLQRSICMKLKTSEIPGHKT